MISQSVKSRSISYCVEKFSRAWVCPRTHRSTTHLCVKLTQEIDKVKHFIMLLRKSRTPSVNGA